MAHELEIVGNKASMFYIGTNVPWHGLGTQLDSPPSIEDALKAANLDWEVKTFPLYSNIPLGTKDVHGRDQFLKVPVTDSKSVIRTSDNKVLGVVGKSYTPVQNRDGFAFFDEAIEAGLVSLETAGSLRGGRRVWMLAHINDAEFDVVKNDTVKAYFLVSNSHDGTLAVRVGFTGIRVVCANTLSLAHHEGKGKLLQVRHTKNVKNALDKLKEIVNWQRQTFSATVEQFQLLASMGCNETQLRQYVTEVFEPEIKTRQKDDTTEESQAESVDNLMAKIVPLFEGGKGTEIKGVRGTMWAAYNSVTEFQTHYRGRENDTRLDSLWFGQNKKTNERAFDVAMKMAA